MELIKRGTLRVEKAETVEAKRRRVEMCEFRGEQEDLRAGGDPCRKTPEKKTPTANGEIASTNRTLNGREFQSLESLVEGSSPSICVSLRLSCSDDTLSIWSSYCLRVELRLDTYEDSNTRGYHGFRYHKESYGQREFPEDVFGACAAGVSTFDYSGGSDPGGLVLASLIILFGGWEMGDHPRVWVKFGVTGVVVVVQTLLCKGDTAKREGGWQSLANPTICTICPPTREAMVEEKGVRFFTEGWGPFLLVNEHTAAA
ncbi:hypothetical protein EGW08_015076 [Elysia chlorotica]|uniref:Uncharacterized protein n=1 Tax=Elysia chlorotica TaxID=188477 RepID=A0A433T6I9_ELYCH|nr:hypothetical protein EGW08_015076 [Elysia chlorotica]